MFSPGGEFYPEAWKLLARELAEAAEGLQNVVFVSDFIYSDACFFEDWTDQYRQSLARLDRQLASLCDVVLDACYGNLLIYKGTEIFKDFYEGESQKLTSRLSKEYPLGITNGHSANIKEHPLGITNGHSANIKETLE